MLIGISNTTLYVKNIPYTAGELTALYHPEIRELIVYGMNETKYTTHTEVDDFMVRIVYDFIEFNKNAAPMLRLIGFIIPLEYI